MNHLISFRIFVLYFFSAFCLLFHHNTFAQNPGERFDQALSQYYKNEFKKLDSLLVLDQKQTALSMAAQLEKDTKKSGQLGYYYLALQKHLQIIELLEEYEQSNFFYLNHCLDEIADSKGEFKAIAHTVTAEFYSNYGFDGLYITDTNNVSTYINQEEAFNAIALHLDSALKLSKNIPFRYDFYPFYSNNDTLKIDFELSLNAMIAELAAPMYFSMYEYQLEESPEPTAILDTSLLFSDRTTFLKSEFDKTKMNQMLVKHFQMYQILIRESPIYHDVLRLKNLYNHFGNKERYSKALRQIISVNPDNPLIIFAYDDLCNLLGSKELPSALELANQGIQKFPNSKYVSLLKARVYNITKKRISMRTEVYYPPAKNKDLKKKMLVQMTLKNCDSVFVKVYKVNYMDYYFDERTGANWFSIKPNLIFDYLNEKGQLAYSHEISVFNPQDYNNHTYEVALPGLQKGIYIVLSSTGRMFNDTCDIVSNLIQVTDKFIVDSDNEYKVVSTFNGKPFSKTAFEVQEIYNDKPYGNKFEISTDANGQINLNEYNTTRKFILVSKDQSIFLMVYLNSRYRENYIQPNRSAIIHTDRTLYRPGQTVHFKSIIHDTLYKVLSNQEIKFKLFIGNQETESLVLTTNRYGSVSGSFKLPNYGVTGSIAHIQTILDHHAFTSEYLKIEEYKLPKFSVVIEKPDSAYKLGDTVTVKVIARALASYPLSNAKVSFHVTRNRWYTYRNSDSYKNIIDGEGFTDDNGEFTISFIAHPDSTDKEENRNYYFELVADVTDLNGELRSANSYLIIGKKAKKLEFQNSNQTLDNKSVVITYTYESLQGKSLAFTGTLEVYKIDNNPEIYRPIFWNVSEFSALSEKDKKQFSHYKRTNISYPQHLVMTKEIANDLTHKINIGNELFEPGFEYHFKLISNEGDSSKMSYTASNPTDNLTLNRFKPIEVYSVNGTTFEAGETAKFAIRSQFKNQIVHVTIESANGVIFEGNIKLKKGYKLLSVPITSNKLSAIRVGAYCIKSSYMFMDEVSCLVRPKVSDLKIAYKSFRSDLEPGKKERWSFHVSGPKTAIDDIEVAACLYDASLDYLSAPIEWQFQRYYPYLSYKWTYGLQSSSYERDIQTRNYHVDINNILKYPLINNNMDYLVTHYDWLAPSYDGDGDGVVGLYDRSYNESGNIGYKDKALGFSTGLRDVKYDRDTRKKQDDNSLKITIRKNFNETAFFIPHAYPDKDSLVHLDFEMPESVTKWRFMLCAHDLNMNTGYLEDEVTTSKKLMVQPNVPRFIRVNDDMTIAAKIVNTQSKELDVKVTFRLLDAETNTPLNWLIGDSVISIKVKGNLSEKVNFKIHVPNYSGLVSVVFLADGGLFGDGELRVLPVLSNKTLVQTSMPITIRKAGTKQLDFKALKSNTSSTLETKKLAVEMCEKPYWNALLSLPYLIEYPNECSEQIFSRLFALNIANNLLAIDYDFFNIVYKWGASDGDLFDSKLDKNQDLKSVLISETPWALESKNENERLKRLAKLFNPDFLKDKMNEEFEKLSKLQNSDGSFSWYQGMPPNEYLTQTIVIGFGKLFQMGIDQDLKYKEMALKAVKWLDAKAKSDYHSYIKRKDFNWQPINMSYLYAKSFTFNAGTDNLDSVTNYYIDNAEKAWMKLNFMSRTHLAVAISRLKPDSKIPKLIIRAFDENAKISEEMGMYWPKNINGWYWYQSSVATQAAIMEAYAAINPNDKRLADMQVWLLRNKQTNSWSDTRTTADACYALLNYGDSENPEQEIKISINNQAVIPSKEAQAAGFWRQDIDPSTLKTGNSNITVSSDKDGFAYGAIHWQYLENIDKVNANSTGLSIQRKYFVDRTINGKIQKIEIKNGDSMMVGDIVHVVLYFTSDRDLEFVHLKDQRASCAEPRDVLSAYLYRGNIGYYQNTTDAVMNFFIEYVPKGRFEITYDVSIQQAGQFECGIASIQCLYAPEFIANSAGMQINVR